MEYSRAHVNIIEDPKGGDEHFLQITFHWIDSAPEEVKIITRVNVPWHSARWHGINSSLIAVDRIHEAAKGGSAANNPCFALLTWAHRASGYLRMRELDDELGALDAERADIAQRIAELDAKIHEVSAKIFERDFNDDSN